jgi:hypothetical protein
MSNENELRDTSLTAKAVRSAAERLSKTAAVVALLLAAPAAAATPDAVGGGFADAGIHGAYYSNSELEGTPSFTRHDVRIDFDWGELRPVGGSTAEPYRSFPRDGFSVRWTGRIIARFSEAYTFHGDAADGVRMKIRPIGQAAWTTLVDRWSKSGVFESIPFKMRSHELYEIQLDYRENEEDARCVLMWRSKSTPSEVIDPIRQQGINLSQHIWASHVWADLMKSSRYGVGADKIDSEGWPTESGVELVASESFFPADPQMSGTYLINFEGQAELRQDCCNNAVFQSNGRAYQLVKPRSAGYDASTNSTTSLMTVDGSRTMLNFDDTQRKPGDSNNGVTRIKLMRPIAQGSAAHHRADEIVYRPFKEVVQDHFTVLRYVMSDKDTGGEWSQRTPPSHAFFVGTSGQPNWEYLVMLANETGRDLYITTPIGANDEYIEKLALLTRYGSDGREPYRAPTAEPIYPPLNSNLRLYVEFDNEIWNWAFESTDVAKRITKAEHDKVSEVWKAINYDGQAGNPEWLPAMRRWHAIRTVQTSKAFRRVWGDEAMGSKVRILIEYQYDDYQETALLSLDFIDAYYNNRTGQHVPDPKPVAHYLWGGGGAAYYGLANSSGEQSHTVFRDSSFETPAIEAGSRRVRPKGSAWTFSGTAGLIHPQPGKEIEGFKNLAMPSSGKQAAFLLGTGSISQRIDFKKAGHYAIAFNGAGVADDWPEYQPFDILVDDRKVSSREQDDARVSPDTAIIGGWFRDINSLDGEWGSAVFHINAPGRHTITFVGRDVAPNYLLVDAVRIASADAIMSSGFDKGEAQGQEGVPDLAYQLRSQAKYARSFGLQVIAYESGWSLGGDFNQVPLQNWCKLEDSRATGINDRAMKLWDLSGSFMTVWGVYKYWPSYDFANAADYPIMQSIRSGTRRTRDEPTYGRTLPAALRSEDADWSHSTQATGWRQYVPCFSEAGDSWLSWMLIAPETGTYSIRVEGEGRGRLVIEVDGEPIAEHSSLGEAASAPVAVKLTKGAHALRAVILGEIELVRIDVGAN